VIGSLAASPREGLGLVWFDAHSDAETPESSASGFLDGMGLAIVLGRCWRPLLDSIPCAPVDGSRVALIGAREISAAAGQLLHESGVTIVPPAEARKGGIGTAVERLREAGVCRVHVHLDLDVLDPDLVGPANSYALPDGLSEAQLLAALRALTGAFEVLSASVASYDPGLDVDGTVAAAGLRLIDFLATA
jgi:arginase